MRIKVLVIGKNGQLGQSLQKIVTNKNQYLRENYDFCFIDRENLDLNNNKNIENYFNKNNDFDVIINVAAYTNVDKAEFEKELANQINHLAVQKIVEIISLHKKNTYLIHVSTDYVFDGTLNKPYSETSVTTPINYYGLSKLKGEQAILNSTCNAAIIRTSWLYSEFGNNFVKTMLKLATTKNELSVVEDQIGSPTYAGDLALIILRLLRHKFFNTLHVYVPEKNNKSVGTQIYHFANNGICSRYDFAKEIFKLKNIDCVLKPIKTNNYINEMAQNTAQRPRNSALDSSKIQQNLNFEGIIWKCSLRRFLENNRL